jgi:glutaminyl-tRNA synthetase
VIKNEAGEIVELLCTYDPATKGTNPEGYKPNGVIHWVSDELSVPCEIRMYDRLFTEANPDGSKEKSFLDCLNPDSLVVLNNARAEAGLKGAEPESRYQFERMGYFCVDPDSSDDRLVINRTVTLRDSWAKAQG